MSLRKLQIGCIAVALIAAEPPMPSARGKRLDLHGDPLPEGAVMRLGTLQGRTGWAELAISADSKTIVGLRWERYAKGTYVSVWDAATGKLRQTHELPSKLSRVITSAPNGALGVLSPDRDEPIVWDVLTDKPIQTLIREKGGTIYPAAFSPNRKRLAAVHLHTKGNTVFVWDLDTGKAIFAKEIRNEGAGERLLFSPDGNRLLVPLTAREGGMRCWDIPTGRLLWENKELGSDSMVITPDGKVLSAQPRSSVVDLATGQPISFKHMPPVGEGDRLTLTPDGRTLLVADGNRMRDVIVWDLVNGKAVRTLDRAGDIIVVASDGKSIITSNGALQRWDLATGKPLYPDTFAWGHAGEVVALAFSADGSRLASGSTDGTVRLWDTATGRPLRVWRGHRGRCAIQIFLGDEDRGVHSLDITPDGRYVLSGGSDECLRLWDASTGKEVRSIALPRREEGEVERRIHGVRISADGARAVGLFSCPHPPWPYGQRYLKLTTKLAAWNLKTGEMVTCHAILGWAASNSAISSDGRALLLYGTLWDMASGEMTAQLEGKFSGEPCAFSHDGALAVGGASRKGLIGWTSGVRVWETASGKTIAHLKTKSREAHVCFHPDGHFVATNDEDGIQVWDVRTSKVVARLKKQEQMRGSESPYRYGSCFAFAPDGRRLATGHRDSTILLWDIPLPAPKREPLAAKELESLWTDLASADAAKAWRAVWRMADAPKEVLPWLRAQLRPAVGVSADAIRELVADLDDNSFKRRQAAEKRLKELGWETKPALRSALETKPSPEQRRRIQAIMATLPSTPPTPSAEELRQLRAVIVLERIGSPEARRVLEVVAKGPESARLTRQALAALAGMP